MTQMAVYLRDHSAPDAVVAAGRHRLSRVLFATAGARLGGLVEPETGKLRKAHEYEEIVERGFTST